MMPEPVAVVILAAGIGSRMNSARPKVMHPIAGRPMIAHLLATVDVLGPSRRVVVIGPGMPELEAAVAPAPVAIQAERRGTAHAVLSARAVLEGFSGTVLVMLGDVPMVRPETLRRMVAARVEQAAAVVVLGFRPPEPDRYGRLVVDGQGALQRIVEHADATAEEREIRLCNAGLFAIDGAQALALLDAVGDGNAQGEYYLTDIVAIARGRGLPAQVVEGEADELLGVNSRADLAVLERRVQDGLRAAAMAGGATLADPGTVWFSHDTRVGRDVTIGPNVVFGPQVQVGDGAEIRAFCHLEGVAIGPGAVIGPFARLRPGSEIGAGAHIGNFVEVKAAAIGAGAKANHLSYLGDVAVGAGANIGAGTITCNYDGFLKHRTEIGEGAFIGSNTALVAPVRVGARAVIGAGSTITRDVAAEALSVARGEQREMAGGGARLRRRKAAEKAARRSGSGRPATE